MVGQEYILFFAMFCFLLAGLIIGFYLGKDQAKRQHEKYWIEDVKKALESGKPKIIHTPTADEAFFDKIEEYQNDLTK